MSGTRYTLLTGATGLLGQFLLADLLRARIPTAVLVRSQPGLSAAARIERLLHRMEQLSGRTFPRPVVLTGNLTQEHLGLEDADRDWIMRHCGRVLHSAASLSFKPAAEHPQGEPLLTNVTGLNRLIDLCRQAGVREFHHVSSAYVCGLRTGEILETEGREGQQFANDYEHSKLTGEELLAAAGFDSLTVHRPSIVVDLLPDSSQIGDRTIYLAFSVFQFLANQGPLPPLGTWLRELNLTGEERKNIIPADWAARCIVEVLRRPELHGETYHLTNPRGTSLLELEGAFRQAHAQSFAEPRVLPLQRVKRPAAADQVIGQFLGTFAPYLRDDPRFNQQHITRALQVCGLPPCPEVGVAAMTLMAQQQLQEPRRGDALANSRAEMSCGVDAEPPFSPVGLEFSCESFSTPHPDSAGWGLSVTGQWGGDWTLRPLGKDRWLVGRGVADDVWGCAYISSAVWNQPVGEELSFADALRAGRMTVEAADGKMDFSPLYELLHALRREVARRAGCAAREQKMEIA